MDPQTKCRWCGNSYEWHSAAGRAGGVSSRMPCGGLRAWFLPRDPAADSPFVEPKTHAEQLTEKREELGEQHHRLRLFRAWLKAQLKRSEVQYTIALRNGDEDRYVAEVAAERACLRYVLSRLERELDMRDVV